jgi:hypothetical protein
VDPWCNGKIVEEKTNLQAASASAASSFETREESEDSQE